MKTIILSACAIVFTLFTVKAQPPGTAKTTTVKPTTTVPMSTNRPAASSPSSKSDVLNKSPALPFSGEAIFQKQKAMPDGSVIRQTYTVSSLRTTPMNNVGRSVANAKPQKTVINTSAPNRTAYGKEVCQTEQTRISASNLSDISVDFSYSQQVANIYPGALYKFDDYYSGNWNAINYGRNPITLVASVKNNNGSPVQTVNDSSYANIARGVSSLFGRFTRNPSDISQEGFKFTVYEVENQAEMAFKIGASGHYLGISASNMFSSSNREKHKYLLIDATKEMFSINVQAPQNGLMVDPNAATADMMYISNVTYGARVLACVELDAYDKEVADKFSGGAEFLFTGGSVAVESYFRELNTTMKISFYAVGGNARDAQMAYSFDEVKKLCNNIISGLTYQTSQPISTLAL